jgi:hypothetical protein
VNDKEIEKNRYNNSAIGALENNSILNIDELMLPLRVPYIHYRKMIQEYADESTNNSNKSTFIFQYSINFIKHFIIIPITQTTRTHYKVK